jgi:acyl dehydratase
MAPAILDPEIGINLATMLHGSQEFEWDEPVCDGDVISTTAACKEIYENDGKGFYVFETISTNQEGEQTVKGTWTNIVRGV